MLQYRECWHFYVLAMAQAQLQQLGCISVSTGSTYGIYTCIYSVLQTQTAITVTPQTRCAAEKRITRFSESLDHVGGRVT